MHVKMITGHSRVMLVSAFLIMIILGHRGLDMGSPGPTIIFISVGIENHGRPFIIFTKFGIFIKINLTNIHKLH